MKKLLFGLLALSLSAVTFAANPGTATDATMTVEAKLNVVDATDKVVIEQLTDAGTWQVVSSTVAFDHGTVAKGTTTVPTPSLLKNFRVRKLSAAGADELAGTVAVTMGANTNGNFDGTLKSGTNTIDHTFRYTTTPIIGADKIAKFNIESNVPTLASNQAIGAYNRVETVAVKVTTP